MGVKIAAFQFLTILILQSEIDTLESKTERIAFSTFAFQNSRICCARCSTWSWETWNCTDSPDKSCSLYLTGAESRLPAWTYRAVPLDPDSDWVLVAWLSKTKGDNSTSKIRIGKMIVDFSTCKRGRIDWMDVADEGVALNIIYRLTEFGGQFGRPSYEVDNGNPIYDLTFEENKRCRSKSCGVTIIRKGQFVTAD